MEVARHVKSTQNRKLVIFLQCIKKKVSQLLLCSIVIENIQLFNGGPLMFVVTCFTGVSSLTGCIGSWASLLGCWEVRNVINFDKTHVLLNQLHLATAMKSFWFRKLTGKHSQKGAIL